MKQVKKLIKVFFGLLMWTGLITLVTFWVSPILGTITVLFLAFLWTFAIAPRLAGQLVAAIILARKESKAKG